ncbi:MAG: hypothetical protein LQ351_005887 [Letrouitia transgressa]|nr:MAG: hypothetical protein LQ351_005887 [Letrouitia transgressa]
MSSRSIWSWVLLVSPTLLAGQELGRPHDPSNSGGSSKGGNKQSSHESPDVRAAAAVDNARFARYTLSVLAAVVAALFVYRVVIHSVRYIRTLTCLNNDTQEYFKMPNLAFGSVKQHLLYAPLFRRRHNREIHFGWFHLGYVPTRFQSLFLLGVIGMNVVLSVYGIEWHGDRSAALSHLRNRTGTLSIVNMIPLVVMAGRNNPLIGLLNISFDSFNLVHRWFGRIVVLQALAHTLAHVVKLHDKGNAILRHALYETFLHLHIALVVVSIAFLWMHLDGLPPQKYLLVVIILWVAERSARVLLLVYRNVGRGGTQAELELLPGDACRVTIKMARPWTFKPGQHGFITIPSVGLWTSHPFSLAWSESESHADSEKAVVVTQPDILAPSKPCMSMIVRRRDGFTEKLFRKAERSPLGRTTVTALIEGPYGGRQVLHSYGTVMIFAGGVGITHQVPFVRDLVAGYANGTVATRRVVLIWVIQSPEHLEWIRPWMTTILAMDKRRDILRIQLFVTRPRSTKEIHSPSATVQMFPGKPNVDTLIEMESENQVGAMGVSVCGTGGLSDDVRAAVRRRQGVRNIDFLEESFTW